MKTFIRWAAILLAALMLLALPTLYFGGRWALEKYLGEEIKVGEGQLRLTHPHFHWSLALTADSLRYRAPGLDLASGSLTLSASLFRSLWHFSPSVDMTLDTLQITLLPTHKVDSVKVKSRSDSLPFPDINLPASVHLQAKRLVLNDSNGLITYADDIQLKTHGKQAFSLEINHLGARVLDTLTVALHCGVDWHADSVHAQMQLTHGRDAIHVHTQSPKANVWHSLATVKATVASSQPYASALALPKTLPQARDIDVTMQASMPQRPSLPGSRPGGYRFATDMALKVSHFPDQAPYRLTPQQIAFHFAFAESTGTWSLTSHGEMRERIALQGRLQITNTDSLADVAFLLRHLQATAQGEVGGIPLVVAKKQVLAEANFTAPLLSANAVQVQGITGDRSRLSVALHRRSRVWDGNFSADVKPYERWVRAFADTLLSFKALRVQGKVAGNEVKSVTDITHLSAFGVMADSLHLVHSYSHGNYTLEPSLWHLGKVTWKIRGKVGLSRVQKPIEFHLAHSEFGSLDFFMPRPGVMSAKLEKLAIHALPYRGLDSLQPYQSQLSGEAEWNRNTATGKVDLAASGQYHTEAIHARVRAHWDTRILEIESVDASLGGSNLQAGARLNLHGRPFYEVAKLKRDDFALVFLKANHFDLAKAMQVAMPKPPLISGQLDGQLSYSDSLGFMGHYQFTDIKPAATTVPVSLKKLDLNGNGDSLVIHAVTFSPKEPLWNDSLTLAITGILGQEQGLDLRVVAANTLILGFQGRIQEFKTVSGRLRVNGGILLPGKSGAIRDLQVSGNIASSFKELLPNLTVAMDTLSGVYATLGYGSQHFSAPLTIQHGKVHLPNLLIRSEAGEEIKGQADYALTGSRTLTAKLHGQALALQLSQDNTVRMRGIQIQVEADSAWLQVQADIAALSGTYVKPPLRAAASFSRLTMVYRAPQGKHRNALLPSGDIPFLKVDALLDTSTARYRLRSMATLQNLFRRSPGKHVAKRDSPLQVQIHLETSGAGNSIETDIFRMEYVGDFSLRGTLPYALAQGRINATQGQLGTRHQAYELQNLEIKWLNSPIEEGSIRLEAQKRLARDCEATTTDSCVVITRLTGQLSQMQFAYDSDCQGAYGTGADVSALVYSVRRGCFSSAFSSGSGGKSYQEAALTLFEPMASQYLTEAVEKVSGKWITSAQITGLGALGSAGKSDSGSTGHEAISIEVLSKEVLRTRLRAKSAYTPENGEASNPWDYRLGIEWRPPLERWMDTPQWKARMRNNVKVEAALYTDRNTALEGREAEVRRSLGFNYLYDFWGKWGEVSPRRFKETDTDSTR